MYLRHVEHYKRARINVSRFCYNEKLTPTICDLFDIPHTSKKIYSLVFDRFYPTDFNTFFS